jgi:hypothetical protein
MRSIIMAVLAVVSIGVATAFAAETSIKGTIYADWKMNMTKGARNQNEFTIDRAYFGAESKLSDYTFMRITFDVRPEKFSTPAKVIIDSDGDTVKVPSLAAYTGYPIVLKYAYADFKPKPFAKVLKIRLGLQPTMYLNYMDGIWGRRYIEKSTNDLNSWTSTADLGATALFALDPLGNLGELGVSILNGTKYSDFVDQNREKDFNLFAKLTPFYNSGDFNQVGFFSQIYSGVQNKAITGTATGADWKRQITSFGVKLAYQKKVDFCVDLNTQTLGQGVGIDEVKQSGVSFFGNIYLNAIVSSTSLFKTLILYGRVDQYDPNTDNADDGNTLTIAGIECAPIKGVRASLAYRKQSQQTPGTDDDNRLMFNTEFKF